ncbi:hypothetical protein [Haladaptatus halobius]|uniref:hypothetical protein n=1 Tax=Haladaptatus halobius TaxID=2884875 RepID=UPI001D0BD355|nr:hypothetical protein [Haladaptatus halobius]
MKGPRLTRWRIESISTDTVVGTDIDTGDPQEWEREWLVQRLGGGEFSVELATFDRVSVTEIDEEQEKHPVENINKPKPHVVVVAYGNDGEKFTQFFAATEPKNWDSLEVVQQDEHVQNFSDELRRRLDEAVYKALKIEQRYQYISILVLFICLRLNASYE